MSPKAPAVSVLIEQAKQALQQVGGPLNEALNALSQFAKIPIKQLEQPDDDYHVVQLLLQYRLNNQDVLRALFSCQQSVWQILGVSPANTMEVNYERLAYALGSDDLHIVLSMLNQLSAALLKLIDKLQNKKNIQQKKLERVVKRAHQKSSFKPDLGIESKPQSILQYANKNQIDLKLQLDELLKTLEMIAAAPTVGEVLNEVAAFQGPISRYYQSVINGMELTDDLALELKPTQNLTHDLTQVMQHAHDTLSLAATALDHQSFFAHPALQSAQSSSKLDLEEQAAKLRLGNFFR